MRKRDALIGLAIALLAFATYFYFMVWRDPTTRAHSPLEARECDAQPGSPIDLASEPRDWLQYDVYLRWTDSDGCLVRIDVISHHQGAAHCGWQSMESITVGRPFGSSIAAGASTANRYVWDPRGVLPDGPIGLELNLPDMPVTAFYTGYQRDGTELWLDEIDESVLYRVTGDTVEAFELSSSGLCA
jgi:hypothetical protein